MTEKDRINNQLKDLFGIDTVTGLPIFRISWSEDQLEKRYGTYDDYTPGGLYIRTVTEVREVPKYRQWIQNKFVLERLVLVPEINKEELPDTKLSYEPLWVFEDKHGNPLPPKIEACKFIIDSVLDAQAIQKMMITGGEKIDRRLPRYVDPENSQEASIALKKERVEKLENELFGDAIGQVGMDLLVGQGISVPHNYEKKKVN